MNIRRHHKLGFIYHAKTLSRNIFLDKFVLNFIYVLKVLPDIAGAGELTFCTSCLEKPSNNYAMTEQIIPLTHSRTIN